MIRACVHCATGDLCGYVARRTLARAALPDGLCGSAIRNIA